MRGCHTTSCLVSDLIDKKAVKRLPVSPLVRVVINEKGDKRLPRRVL